MAAAAAAAPAAGESRGIWTELSRGLEASSPPPLPPRSWAGLETREKKEPGAGSEPAGRGEGKAARGRKHAWALGPLTPESSSEPDSPGLRARGSGKPLTGTPSWAVDIETREAREPAGQPARPVFLAVGREDSLTYTHTHSVRRRALGVTLVAPVTTPLYRRRAPALRALYRPAQRAPAL